MSRAISSKSAPDAAGCVIAFCALFAFIGVVLLVTQLVVPSVRVLRSQSWTPTPCLIRSSNVASTRSSDSTKYYPDIWYSYSFNGQNYDSTRYSFFDVKSENPGSAQKLAGAFPQGAPATCYVNPNDPSQAVLDRRFLGSAWINLFALAFIGAGIGGIVWQRSQMRAAARNKAAGLKSWQPKSAHVTTLPVSAEQPHDRPAFSTTTAAGGGHLVPEASTAASGEFVLKPVMGPVAATCGLTLISLFWNGIVGVFLWAIIFEMKGMGFMKIFIALFLVPFVLIGVLLLVATLSSFGGLFVGRPILTLSTPTLPLGGEGELKWRLKRGLVNARGLRIWLEAREEATYRRGTDSVTDKHVFLSQELFGSTPGGDLNGQAVLRIPQNSMHSFEATNNKILWSIKVKGEVPLWPDFEDEYRLLVTPLSPTAGGAP